MSAKIDWTPIASDQALPIFRVCSRNVKDLESHTIRSMWHLLEMYDFLGYNDVTLIERIENLVLVAAGIRQPRIGRERLPIFRQQKPRAGRPQPEPWSNISSVASSATANASSDVPQMTSILQLPTTFEETINDDDDDDNDEPEMEMTTRQKRASTKAQEKAPKPPAVKYI